MDRKLVSAQDEIEYLAKKHGTSVERVKEIIQQTGSHSREQIEAALDFYNSSTLTASSERTTRNR
jgi:hypothetical protein